MTKKSASFTENVKNSEFISENIEMVSKIFFSIWKTHLLVRFQYWNLYVTNFSEICEFFDRIKSF